MTVEVQNYLTEYTDIVRGVFENSTCKIILYGSYARGDFREDSDIDIMVLVSLTREEIKKFQYILSAATFDYNLYNKLDINPIVVPIDQFEYWKENYPFYANVDREGVLLYGAA